jgi:hypothetical protein
MDPRNKTDALGALMTSTCACRQTLTALREEAAYNRYLDYRYTLHDIQVIDVGDVGGDIRYLVDQSVGAERDGGGRVLHRYAASTSAYTAHFIRRGDAWLLDHVTQFK